MLRCFSGVGRYLHWDCARTELSSARALMRFQGWAVDSKLKVLKVRQKGGATGFFEIWLGQWVLYTIFLLTRYGTTPLNAPDLSFIVLRYGSVFVKVFNFTRKGDVETHGAAPTTNNKQRPRWRLGLSIFIRIPSRGRCARTGCHCGWISARRGSWDFWQRSPRPGHRRRPRTCSCGRTASRSARSRTPYLKLEK